MEINDIFAMKEVLLDLKFWVGQIITSHLSPFYKIYVNIGVASFVPSKASFSLMSETFSTPIYRRNLVTLHKIKLG